MVESTEQQDDDIWLLDDEPESSEPQPGAAHKRPWKVLIVDDEKDVHIATRLAIQDIRYKDRGLELLYANSASQGYERILAHPDTALILLDVVMETDDAGLKLVHRIRNELGNHAIRIVLRTGQPGQAPEQDIILNYDINDYKTKTELTVQKLFTTVVSSLRAYENLLALEKHRQGLTKILDGAADLYHLHSLQAFACGVLKQVGTLLDPGLGSILCLENEEHSNGPLRIDVIAATGVYEPLTASGNFSALPELATSIEEAFALKKSVYRHPYDVLYFHSQNGREFVVHFSPPWPLEEVERNLLEVFCIKISDAYDNLHLYSQLRRSQEATVVALADLAEFRDADTGQHVMRMQKLVDALTQELKRNQVYARDLTSEFIEMIGMASILHDVGKVATPDHILFKPGKLDPDERRIMEQHAMIGAQILQKACDMVNGRSYLQLGASIAGGHHEHFDGHGYPQQLKGEAIPLEARIVAVIDVFDALVSRRPYKAPWTLKDTVNYIRERAGSQFDPQVVHALIRLIEEDRLPIKIVQV
jgi:response regulator RpfG family c-di-GMP phosphodiesterase